MKVCTTVLAAVLAVFTGSAIPAGEAVKLSDYFPPPESAGGWRSLLPEKGEPSAEEKERIREVGGVDWNKLAEAWEFNLSGDADSALVVIRRGWIVGEFYRGYDRFKTRGLYSTTKSYMSTAFGLLLDDMEQGKLPDRKKLTLDTKVCNADWLPESLPLSDPRKADVTLRHLLFATSGIPREGLKVPDDVQARSKRPFDMALGHVEGSPWAKLTGEPGTMFNYSTPGVLHLILAFNHAAGHDLFPYIKDRVCDPIGMENVNWGKGGGYCSAGGFSCSAREHARFCYLSMHRGNWAGRQIVPAGYYDWAWQGTKANSAYGAQWWLADQHPGAPKDFVQTFGQKHNSGCLVPSLDLVFVRIGDGPFPYSWEFEKELVKKVLAAVEK